MFKHPSKSTIDRISAYIEKYNKGKGTIYRTDLSGEIVIELEQDKMILVLYSRQFTTVKNIE